MRRRRTHKEHCTLQVSYTPYYYISEVGIKCYLWIVKSPRQIISYSFTTFILSDELLDLDRFSQPLAHHEPPLYNRRGMNKKAPCGVLFRDRETGLRPYLQAEGVSSYPI